MERKPNIFEQHNMKKGLNIFEQQNFQHTSENNFSKTNLVNINNEKKDKSENIADKVLEEYNGIKNAEKYSDFDCLNIGIPTTIPLLSAIPYADFIGISDSSDEKNFGNVIDYNKNALFQNINKDIGVKYSFLKPYTKTSYSVYTDENLKTSLVFSDFGFYCELMKMFKVETEDKKETWDDLDLAERLLKQNLNDLRKIKYPKELKRKYTDLYQQFEECKKYIKLINLINDKPLVAKMNYIKVFNSIYGNFDEYSEFAKDFSIEKYISEISDMYDKYFSNLKDILRLMSSTPIYFTESCMINENKMALLVAYIHLVNAKMFEEDMQKYLYYIASYLREFKTKHNNTTLEVYNIMPGTKVQKIKINYDYLKEAFKEILVKSPELNFIDLSRQRFVGMTPEEINTYMEEYIEYVRLNWDFLLPNDESIERKTLELINKESKRTKVKDEEAFKRQKLELYYEKKGLFESSEPFCVLEGKAAFDGYRAFCYYNGKVILDKYFANEKTGRLAFGDAIYIMDLASFYMLSKMSKAEIINGKLCQRIYHRGNWKERTLEIINSGEAVSMDNSLAHEFKKLKSRKG